MTKAYESAYGKAYADRPVHLDVMRRMKERYGYQLPSGTKVMKGVPPVEFFGFTSAKGERMVGVRAVFNSTMYGPMISKFEHADALARHFLSLLPGGDGSGIEEVLGFNHPITVSTLMPSLGDGSAPDDIKQSHYWEPK